MKLTALSLSLALVFPGVGFAGVIVVDADEGPGFDFADLQVAVDAAADGDTLLVRGGNYGALVVDGKSLVITRDTGPFPALARIELESLVVRNLGPNQRFIGRGFLVDPTLPFESTLFEDNAGPVWMEEATLKMMETFSVGAKITNCADVTFTGCEVFSDKFFYVWSGSPGMKITGSNVQLNRTSVRVGSGTLGSGASAIAMTDSQLWLDGALLKGGAGAENGCGAGGHGLLVSGLPAVIRMRGSLLEGGLAGCGFQADGQPIAGTPGFLAQLSGFSRFLEASSPVREGEAIDFEFVAAPGELAFVAVSPLHAPAWVPGLESTILSPLTSLTVLLAGTVPSGTPLLNFSVTAPSIHPPFEALSFYAQAIFLDASPAAHVGTGSQVTLLDGQF